MCYSPHIVDSMPVIFRVDMDVHIIDMGPYGGPY